MNNIDFFLFQSKSSCCYGSRKIPQRRRCTYAAAWKTNHWQTGTLSSLVSPIQNQLRRVFNERCCPLKQTNKWYMPICIFDPLLKQTNKQTNKQMNKTSERHRYSKTERVLSSHAKLFMYYHASLSNLFGCGRLIS